MKEAEMLRSTQAALERAGIDDQVVAAALFFPRGHVGGAFVGGIVGGSLGDEVGGLAGSVATVAGAIGGRKLADARSGLPERMMIAVSATQVYGFDTQREEHREATDLIFQIPRDRLEVHVHPRVNVRVVELVDEATSSKVELEGDRLPGFHVSSVIDALQA